MITFARALVMLARALHAHTAELRRSNDIAEAFARRFKATVVPTSRRREASQSSTEVGAARLSDLELAQMSYRREQIMRGEIHGEDV